ncbi:uncharacterized protein C7orf57 homolog isoform X2 [Callorhinchus milii]|nr:uncharacterized protein C7orf57 homolog isoform X2 [Callorhinchus milii]|eukprot:gi/632945517/ref/XP_007888105.1/ PREDICTED: uncharacterized protein C7orf57 homolog isoform X2 [Callorhinchus milii]
MTTTEERYRGRRTGIHDTDSDYVKLAKRGGLSDLLTFDGSPLKSTRGSSRKPGWLTPETTLQESKPRAPDYMCHDEASNINENGGDQISLAPVVPDEKCSQEEEECLEESENSKSGIHDAANKRQRDRNLPPQLQMEAMTLASQENQRELQPSISSLSSIARSVRRKEAPVSMQKLLSFGYADDWFLERKDVQKPKDLNTENYSVAVAKAEVTPEENQPQNRGRRTTGMRGNGRNKATTENDSFFKIFGEHRLNSIPAAVENQMQSEIAFA